MKKPFRIVWITALVVLVSLVCFGAIDFCLFIGSDLLLRAIQGCAFITCMVIAVCAYVVLREINKLSKK